MKAKEDWRWKYHSFDFYVSVDNPEEWIPCPTCGLVPRIWVFDNGSHARCVCGEDRYHPTNEVSSEPIGSVVGRTGGFAEYNKDNLRRAWNKYIMTIQEEK